MKKINLKGISEILSEKEMKNVMGGSFTCTSSGCSGSCYMSGKWVGWCYPTGGCLCGVAAGS